MRFKTLIYYCKCPSCKKEALVDDSRIYTSIPPMYSFKCPHCGEFGYIECSEAKVKEGF